MTYSKQLIGHKFCVVCGGNLFVGDGVYPPGGGGGGSLGNGSPRDGGESSSLGGDGHGAGKVPLVCLPCKTFNSDRTHGSMFQIFNIWAPNFFEYNVNNELMFSDFWYARCRCHNTTDNSTNFSEEFSILKTKFRRIEN